MFDSPDGMVYQVAEEIAAGTGLFTSSTERLLILVGFKSLWDGKDCRERIIKFKTEHDSASDAQFWNTVVAMKPVSYYLYMLSVRRPATEGLT